MSIREINTGTSDKGKGRAEAVGEGSSRPYDVARGHQPSHTPGMSPQALAFHSPQDRDPDMHTENFIAACRRYFSCCDKELSPEAIELQEHVRFSARFEHQRSEKLQWITNTLNDSDTRIVGMDIEEIAIKISQIATWAEDNSRHLSVPSENYEQAKHNFEEQEKILFSHIEDKIAHRIGASSKPTKKETNIINDFNNNGVTPFLEQLQARLQPPQAPSPNWSIN